MTQTCGGQQPLNVSEMRSQREELSMCYDMITAILISTVTFQSGCAFLKARLYYWSLKVTLMILKITLQFQRVNATIRMKNITTLPF